MNFAGAGVGLIRRGDWLVLLSGVLFVLALSWHYWMGKTGQRLVIKQGGVVFLNASLAHSFAVNVPGPLGITRIEVLNHRARVRSDPGPRQLCVHEGWLSRAGEVAICLPNQVSMEIVGPVRKYDSLNY